MKDFQNMQASTTATQNGKTSGMTKTKAAPAKKMRKPESTGLQAKAYNRDQKSKVTPRRAADSESNLDSDLDDPSHEIDDLDYFSVADFKRLLGTSGVADLRKLAAAQGLANDGDEKAKSLQ